MRQEIFEEIVVKNFPEMIKHIKPQWRKAWRVPRRVKNNNNKLNTLYSNCGNPKIKRKSCKQPKGEKYTLYPEQR